MIIPIQELNSETLHALVEAFVLREGTDYGVDEVDLTEKVEQVMAQLKSGEAVILYSELHESCDIVPKAELPRYEQAEYE